MSSRYSCGIPFSVVMSHVMKSSERAAEVARGEADRHPDHEVHEGRDEADEQRDLPAEQEPHDLAAADLVGAEEVRRRVEGRLLVGVEEVLLLELVMEDVVREHGSEDRDEGEEEQDDHRCDGQPVVPQLVPGVVPEAPRRARVGR